MPLSASSRSHSLPASCGCGLWLWGRNQKGPSGAAGAHRNRPRVVELRRVLGVSEGLSHEIEVREIDPLHHVGCLRQIRVEERLGRGEHNEPPVEDRDWGLHDKEVEIPFLVLVRLLVVLLRLDKELDSLC